MGRRERARPRVSEEEFVRLLGEHGCPLPPHWVRALLAGVAAGGRRPPYDRLRAALWDGSPPPFSSKAVERAFAAGLRSLLADVEERVQKLTFRLVPVAPQRTVADLRRYAVTRQDEVNGFCQGLELAVGGEELDSITCKALNGLVRVCGTLDRVIRMADQHPDMKFEDRRELFSILREVDGLIEDHVGLVWTAQQRALAARRAQRPALRVVPGGRAPERPAD